MRYGGWRPYVPVAQRRASAMRKIKRLRSTGVEIEPIEIRGTKIANTFWGVAWCKHLEQFSDYDNRLPRGRTYVRNGSVVHLALKQGNVEAIVAGSELYHVNIRMAPLTSAKWKHVRKQCAGQIGSMLELLQGQLSNEIMRIVTDPNQGLFPQPSDIKLHCDCPDSAEMCKHVAAVLYGVGARLDEKPELLFMLRKVDHEALIGAELDMQVATTGTGKRRRLANQDLSSVFGVEIDDPPIPVKKAPPQTTFAPTGAAVARLRKQRGMTLAEFADLLGVSPQTVAKWESKRGKLRLQPRSQAALSRIARKANE
ncbi:MAG: putative Zn finger protein/DNA-binding XRE family transcriptional regulator [Gammaproteobacteria bacterium]|jgi:uncharacterized Zn finger protein/DNA-binding XRE family transcriptional regulator